MAERQSRFAELAGPLGPLGALGALSAAQALRGAANQAREQERLTADICRCLDRSWAEIRQIAAATPWTLQELRDAVAMGQSEGGPRSFAEDLFQTLAEDSEHKPGLGAFCAWFDLETETEDPK